MKISDLKIVHIVLVLAIVLWCWLFFDWQRTKYQIQFEDWRKQVEVAIRNLDQRMQNIEKVQQVPKK